MRTTARSASSSAAASASGSDAWRAIGPVESTRRSGGDEARARGRGHGPDSERRPTAQVQAAPSAAAPDRHGERRRQPDQVREHARRSERHREAAQVARHVVRGDQLAAVLRPGRSACTRSMPPLKTRPAAPPVAATAEQSASARRVGRGRTGRRRAMPPRPRPAPSRSPARARGRGRSSWLTRRPRPARGTLPRRPGRSCRRPRVRTMKTGISDSATPSKRREERPRGHQHPPEDGPLGRGHLQAQRQRPARADRDGLRQA